MYISEQYLEESLRDVWKKVTNFFAKKKEGTKESINTPKEFFKNLREEDYFTIKFTKVDGSSRTMKCTLNFKNIPKSDIPKNSKSSGQIINEIKKTGKITVYDLENKGWRSLYLASIKYLKTSSNVEYKIRIK